MSRDLVVHCDVCGDLISDERRRYLYLAERTGGNNRGLGPIDLCDKDLERISANRDPFGRGSRGPRRTVQR